MMHNGFEPCLKGNFKVVLNISSVYCEKLEPRPFSVPSVAQAYKGKTKL